MNEYHSEVLKEEFLKIPLEEFLKECLVDSLNESLDLFLKDILVELLKVSLQVFPKKISERVSEEIHRSHSKELKETPEDLLEEHMSKLPFLVGILKEYL